MQLAVPSKTVQQQQQRTIYRILFAIGFVHMLNDAIQAVIPAIFPILQRSMNLTYLELGLIGFALNMTSSVMQPVVGYYTDKRPSPLLPSLGMGCTFLGMLGLALAPDYTYVLLSVILVGLGSAVFHPEGSRIAYLAAGSRRGLAQSIYQVGGNTGSSLAPLMTALIFVPLGQFGAIWFTVVAAAAILILVYVGTWYAQRLVAFSRQNRVRHQRLQPFQDRKKELVFAVFILVLLVFARSWYGAAISNFYAFYLMDEYGITIKEAQVYLFLFLLAGVFGTFCGGPLADRFGKRNIIAFSMLGSAPLALLLPYISAVLAYPLLALLGFILFSSFSVTVVYAQDMFPGKIGTVSGLIVGFAFGMGAVGSVGLGALIDWLGLKTVMIAGGFLPLFGLLTVLLPSDRKLREWAVSP
ncbi:MFS transporter [Bacillaceae bacterium]